jgi:hypothetical protein
MRNNVDGIALAYRVIFEAALASADPALATRTDTTIVELASLVGDVDAKTMEPDRIRAKSEELILALQMAAPKIGLRSPTLEDITQ